MTPARLPVFVAMSVHDDTASLFVQNGSAGRRMPSDRPLARRHFILAFAALLVFYAFFVAPRKWLIELTRWMNCSPTPAEPPLPWLSVVFDLDERDVKRVAGDGSTEEEWRAILYWTMHWDCPDPRANMGRNLFQGCPTDRCYVTMNRDVHAKASAVIFHAFGIDARDLPPRRHANQHYVFFNGEPPHHFAPVQNVPDGFFDVTFTYRLDSDVLGVYNYEVPLEKERRDFSLGKTKLAAWFTSNCNTPSRREYYVRELQNYIPVDVFGKCGTMTCPKDYGEGCNEMLKMDYKFYLAFENSLCRDYVTEKLVRAYETETIPVVMNAANMTLYPPHSFIHVDDFFNPKALADYLLYLNKNHTAYNEYMSWRYDPVLRASHGHFAASRTGFCQLCQRLHDPTFRPREYHDAKQWFVEGGRCRIGFGRPSGRHGGLSPRLTAAFVFCSCSVGRVTKFSRITSTPKLTYTGTSSSRISSMMFTGAPRKKHCIRLQWGAAFCPGSVYTAKIDDDNWLNLPRHVKFLQERQHTDCVWGAPFPKGTVVVRHPFSKYYVPREEYDRNRYPEYFSGILYAFPTRFLPRMLAVSKKIPRTFNDDVYVGGILAAGANLTRKPVPYYAGDHPSAMNLTSCPKRDAMCIHHSSVEDLYGTWYDPCYKYDRLC